MLVDSVWTASGWIGSVSTGSGASTRSGWRVLSNTTLRSGLWVTADTTLSISLAVRSPGSGLFSFLPNCSGLSFLSTSASTLAS